MKQKSLVSNSVFNIIRTFSTLVFPLITFMYASRILGTDGVGKVEFSKNLVGYFVILASLGIANYGIREGAKRRESKDDFSKFVHEIFIINFASIAISLAAFLVIIFSFNDLFAYRELLLAFGLMIVFTPLGVEWVYSALEDYKYITMRTIAFQIFALVIMFVTVKDSNDLIWYSVVLLVSNVGSNIFNIVHMRHYVRLKFYGGYKIIAHLKPIIFLFAVALSYNLYSYIGITMLGFMEGDTAVGLFSAALKINRIIVNILGAIGAVAMPRLSYLYAHNDRPSFDSVAEKVANILLMFSIPCCAGLIFLSEPIIVIFSGSAFIAADMITKVMAMIIVFISLSTFINAHIFIPANKEKYTLLSVFLGLCTCVLLNYFLIPKLGITGAAIGTVVGESIVLVVALIFLRKVAKPSKLFKLINQYLIAALPIVIIGYLGNILFPNPILQSAFVVCLSAVAYLILLWFVFKNEYVCWFADILKRKLLKG